MPRAYEVLSTFLLELNAKNIYTGGMIYRTLALLSLACGLNCSAAQCFNASVQLDYLHWRPCSDGFFLALDQQQLERTFLPNLFFIALGDRADFRTDTKCMDFKSHPGFRLGIVKEVQCWDVFASWIYFQPTAHRSIDSPLPTLIPFNPSDFLTLLDTIRSDFPTEPSNDKHFYRDAQIRATRVEGDWSLDMNILDFGVKRSLFCICPWEVKALFDLRFASLRQELTIQSDGAIEGSSVVGPGLPSGDPALSITLADYSLKDRVFSKFVGVGPRLGGEVRRDLFCGMGVYGSAATSLLYGKRDKRTTAKGARFNSVFVEGDSDDFSFELKSGKWCIRPVTDLLIGLFMESDWECFDLLCTLGWEHHYFFNQGVVDIDISEQLYSSHESGDLSMQGITVSMQVNF